MGTCSSSIINMSWSSAWLALILLGAAACAAYYYRHRIRRSTRRRAFCESGMDEDLYREFRDWHTDRTARLALPPPQPVQPQYYPPPRRLGALPDLPDVAQGQDTLAILMPLVEALRRQDHETYQASPRPEPLYSSPQQTRRTDAAPPGKPQAAADLASPPARHSVWQNT